VTHQIAAARAHADIVVFSIHWGPNMRARPSPEFRAFARAAIDAGVDLIWGHSAHVAHRVEFREPGTRAGTRLVPRAPHDAVCRVGGGRSAE